MDEDQKQMTLELPELLKDKQIIEVSKHLYHHIKLIDLTGPSTGALSSVANKMANRERDVSKQHQENEICLETIEMHQVLRHLIRNLLFNNVFFVFLYECISV